MTPIHDIYWIPIKGQVECRGLEWNVRGVWSPSKPRPPLSGRLASSSTFLPPKRVSLKSFPPLELLSQTFHFFFFFHQGKFGSCVLCFREKKKDFYEVLRCFPRLWSSSLLCLLGKEVPRDCLSNSPAFLLLLKSTQTAVFASAANIRFIRKKKEKTLCSRGENIFCNNFPVKDEHSFLFHRTAKQIADSSRNLPELS